MAEQVGEFAKSEREDPAECPHRPPHRWRPRPHPNPAPQMWQRLIYRTHLASLGPVLGLRSLGKGLCH